MTGGTSTLASFTTDQLRALHGAATKFGERTRQRGRTYLNSGLVGPVAVGAKGVAARVLGTRVYIARWWLAGRSWRGECTCPLGSDCKHLYALALATLMEAARDGVLPREMVSDIPRSPRRVAPLPMPKPPGGREATVPAEGKRPGAVVDEDADDEFDEEDEDEFDEYEDDDEDEYEDVDEDADDHEPSRASLTAGGRDPSRSTHAFSGRPGPGAAARMARRTEGFPGSSPAHARTRALGLRQLREGASPYARLRGLEMLHFGAPWAVIDALQSPRIQRLLGIADPDLRCWRLAHELPQVTHVARPPELEPFFDRADLAERDAERSRRELLASLVGWADGRQVTGERSLRFVVKLTVPPAPLSITIEARMTSKRLNDAPRDEQQLLQLLRDSERDGSVLSPLHTHLLGEYLEGLSRGAYAMSWGSRPTVSTLRRLAESSDGSDAVVWDPALAPDLAARHGIEPGSPVTMGSTRCIAGPVCVVHEGQPMLELHVRWPDGTSVPLDSGLLFVERYITTRRPTALFFTAGKFHVLREAPPAELVERFRDVGRIAISPATDAPLVTSLARGFESMRASLEPYTQVRRAEAVFMLWLDDREEVLRIRFFAASRGAGWRPPGPPPKGGWVIERDPRGEWFNHVGETEEQRAGPFMPAGEPSSPSSGGDDPKEVQSPAPAPQWFSRIAHEDLASAGDWLTRAGARPPMPDRSDGIARGFVIPLAGEPLTRLARALADRPADIRFYATRQAQRLLGAPLAVRPTVSVKQSGVDLLEVSAEWEAEGLRLTPADLDLLTRSRASLVRLSSGWARRPASEDVESMQDALADLGIEPGTGVQKLTLWQLAQARPESLAALERLEGSASLTEAVRKLKAEIAAFRGIPHVAVPAGFHGDLRPYQHAGLEFLAWCSLLGLGSILADDMGLGKTVQTLAWLLWIRQRDPTGGPALVVCPASVTENWRREARRFTPELGVAVLESGTQRRALLAGAASHDLLITNYALLRRDLAAWREVPLLAAVLDEAQNIKNPEAATAHAARALTARHRLALTGTPIENRALDLWSIMEFVNPGLLGPRAEFASRFDRTDAPMHRRRLLASRVRPVLLRRLKQEVARDLPDRIEERLDCDLHPAQRKLYLAQLAEAREAVQALAAAPGGLQRHKIEILAALTRLRQICCHPALVGAPRGGSGKFDAFWELLESLLARGEKVLVFSQFVECLLLLETELRARGVAYRMLTGSTRKRDELVAAFQASQEPEVFLISLKAGGTGLNLTSACHVIVFDPWWNPAVEAQAIDRAHRIGQDRTVVAWRILTRGTIEEKILELQSRKAALASDVLGGEEALGRSLTREDLDYLLMP